MPQEHVSRREISMLAGAIVAGVGAVAATRAGAGEAVAPASEVSRSNAAIHQEVVIAVPASRVYRALTTAEGFDRIVRLSAAMNSSMQTMLGTAPTAIDARPGGAFALFGGYISGRNLELVPNARLVQAWRAGNWPPGLYSIAEFALASEGSSTRIVFDHRGFPNEDADHLAAGWHGNYWVPLAKSLAPTPLNP
ncbi:MAG TPA: SRPBCC domain-containing protein [Rhizomicrobium sp.]|nr:SRPBCC domain-containing protein [Rhizomicrobium sp.]